MPRYMLTEELWSKLREILLQFSLYDKAGLRRTVESILFRMRTGIPWRDLPEHFGKWNSIYKAFNHGSKKGILEKLFSGLTTDSDLKWVFIDGRYV
jgi:transposase